MQITDKLNSDQRLLPEESITSLKRYFSIYQEMEDAGFEVDFYMVRGFGGLTIVPSNKRVRVKVNHGAMQIPGYAPKLSDKIQKAFDGREEIPEFVAGKKVSLKFIKPRSIKKWSVLHVE